MDGVNLVSESPTELTSFSFVLAVPDLRSSAAYFRDALGFRRVWPVGGDWQLAARGAVRIMLGQGLS